MGSPVVDSIVATGNLNASPRDGVLGARLKLAHESTPDESQEAGLRASRR